mgnify:FL=1
MNQKNSLIILLIVLGLVFAGCSSQVGDSQSNIFGSGESDTSSSSSSLRGGVELDFMDGNPPKEMFKGEDYTFTFVFTNEQKHPIEDLVVQTRGFDRGFVNGLDEEYSVNTIPRANDISGPGIYSGLVVSGVDADGFTGDYSLDPVFDYCYTAKTTFREQVCVPNSRNQCDINVDSSREQNGLVRVSLGELQVTGDSMVIPIEFSNSGSGEVVNECFNTDDFNRNYELVNVMLGSQEGNCRTTSSDSYTLINGASTIFCEFSRADNNDEAYVSQLSLEIEYMYQDTTELDIEVRDLDRLTN